MLLDIVIHSNGATTTYDTNVVVAVLIMIVLVLGFIFASARSRKIYKLESNKKNWISVTANIVNKKDEVSGKVVRMGSKYNVQSYDIYEPSKTTYVSLEYEIDGKKYRTKTNAKNVNNKTSGSVAIKCLKGYPKRIKYPGKK